MLNEKESNFFPPPDEAPIEHKSRSFSDQREQVENLKPIVLEEGTRWERVITPADQIRFAENDRLAEVVYGQMIDLIDGRVDLQQLSGTMHEKEPDLSPRQNEILSRIYNNLQRHAAGPVITTRHPERYKTLQQVYKDNPSAACELFQRYAEAAWKIPPHGISPEQVSITSWGAVVVKVTDPNTWHKLIENNHSGDSDGFKMRVFFTPSINRDENSPYREEQDPRYIQAQANRTVVIKAFGLSSNEEQEILRHELFHELYDEVISPTYQSRYRNPAMDDTFRMVKNEMVAYALSRQWQTDEKMYFPSSMRKYGKLPNIEQMVTLDILHQQLPTADHDEINLDPPDKKLADYTAQLGPTAAEKAAKDASNFVRDIATTWREIARLKLLRSHEYNQAAKAVLTAQSFKEIAYKLSRIDNTRIPDVIKFATKHDSLDLERAALAIEETLYFRVPTANVDQATQLIEQKLAKTEDLSVESRADLESSLKYYQKYCSRWLKPGEQRQ